MKSFFRSVLGAGLLFAGAQVHAQDTPSTFSSVIKPIFEAKCVSCHGAEHQDAKLRLDSREAALQAGETGYPALIPGNATFSNIVKRITLPPDHIDVMPPKEHGTLTAEEILSIIHWINRGAEWDEGAVLVATVNLHDAPPAAEPAPAPAAEPAPEPAPAPEAPAPAPEPAATPAADTGGVNFASQILPIFEARCFECHAGEKKKGELLLDSKEAILKGGDQGPSLVAGNAAESLLHKLIALPADHIDIMPAKGDPLTAEQIALIAQWINEGANFGDWTVYAVQAQETVNLLEQLAQNVQPPAAETLAKFQEQGAVAMQLGQTSPLVRVDFQLAGEEVTDEHLASLAEVADQLTWLNLATTKVTDAGLAQLAPLKKLTSLHLEKTGITDAGLQHLAGLENLQYLNLYGTQVTDAGLEHLKGLKNLERLYVWQTGVTADGAAALKAAMPNVEVNMGAELALAAAPAAEPAAAPADMPADAPKVVPAVFFDAEGCCAKAAAEGKECDHPCCVEARSKGEVCAKCNPNGAAKQALAANFAADGCCAKALAEGKECDHPCCVEARAKGEVCAKCNPAPAPAEAPAPADAPAPAPAEAAVAPALAAFYDEGGCCAQGAAAGTECAHPCCVEARGKGEACAKCNPNGAAKQALAAKFDADGCCAKALAEGKDCDHPCCVEARAKGELCAKCNPKGAAPAAAPAEAAQVDLAAQFDAEGCCGKAHAAGAACDHPCCTEAGAKGELCFKCNPEGAKKAALAKGLKESGCCFNAFVASTACDHPCCVDAAGAGSVCEACNPKAA